MIEPKQVIIEVTSRCNLKCKYCPTLEKGAPAHDMDLDFFKSIVDRITLEMPDTTVIPWMNGEPLLNPNYYEMIKYITDRKLRAYITTNATIWENDFFHHITDKNSIYQLIFSLDGLPNTGSIEKARPGMNESIVLSNIHRFLRLKNSKKKNIDLGIKLCRRGQDWGEAEDYIKYWLNTRGIDFVCVGDALVDDEGGIRTKPCQYPDNNFMVIRWDGSVVFCAYNLTMTNNPDYAVGKLDSKESLLSFYNNKKFDNFRRLQNMGVYHPPCNKCGFAYTGIGYEGKIKFRNWNKTIYHSKDYYNGFYSLKKKRKNKSYYSPGGKLETYR